MGLLPGWALYMHGIYVVYRGISIDIPSFLKPDFAAGPMLLVSFNAQTCVGDQECFIPRATMASAPGEKAAHKRLNPTAANEIPSMMWTNQVNVV